MNFLFLLSETSMIFLSFFLFLPFLLLLCASPIAGIYSTVFSSAEQRVFVELLNLFFFHLLVVLFSSGQLGKAQCRIQPILGSYWKCVSVKSLLRYVRNTLREREREGPTNNVRALKLMTCLY